MSQIIAEYKFDNILYDLIPEFNEGFEYTYKDVLEGNVTTRTIYSNELPTLLRFGNSDTSGETGDSNKYNSLLEVLYLASSEITYAGLMFHRCANVSYICPFILTNKNNSLHGIFSGCHSLTSLDVSNFDTSNVTDMSYAFYTNNLIELDLSDWDTSNVTNMNHILYSCQNLKTLNISNWNLNNVDNMGWFANQCDNLNEIIMNDSDYNSINKIISELPITTNGNKCNFCIGGVDDISKVNIREGWDIMNQYKIAEYKFDSSIDTLFSEVNEGFEYTHTDIDNGDGTITRTIYSDQLPTKVSFEDCEGLLEVNYLNTSELTTLRKTFKNCYNVTSINATDWDTSKVKNMSDMFMCCYSLTSVGNLSNWQVGNVIYMSSMFDSCESLISLNVSNWDTSNVTDMSWLFEQCYSLETIIGLDTWNVSNVTDMSGIFAEDYELTTLNISNWSLNSELFTDDYMFYDNFGLDTIIMNNSDSDSVNRIIYELPTRTSDTIGTLTIAGLDDISQVDITTAESKFWNIVNKFLVAEYKFDNTLYDLIPEFDDSYTYTYKDIVDGEVTTRTIYSDDLPTLMRFGQVSVGGEVVSNASLSLLEVYQADTSNITNANAMFRNCKNMISVGELDTSNVTTMFDMFSECYNLTQLDLSSFNTSNVTNMSHMFYNCQSLTSLDLSGFNTSKVTDMQAMFQHCNLLTSLDLSNWDTINVKNMTSMFGNCKSLTSLDLSNFDTGNVTNMAYMFNDCNNLTSLTMKNSDYSSVNKIIEHLPIRTSDSMGTLDITGIDDIKQANINSAKSKYWIVKFDELTKIYIGNIIASALYLGDIKINSCYLGDQKIL